ncbi:hypothetical protein TrVFT333_007791 [Trichoderma virens FT-333]|nr:hypothetical protein TrVFT333_007791 [Trichoderma virens FT-333]
MRAPNAKGGSKKYAANQDAALAHRAVLEMLIFLQPSAIGYTLENAAASSSTAVGVGAKGKGASRKRRRDSSDDSDCENHTDPSNGSNNNIASGDVDSVGQNSAAVGSDSSDRLLPGLSGDDDLTLPSLDAEVSPLLELSDLLMKKNGILTRKFSFLDGRTRPSTQPSVLHIGCRIPELRHALDLIPENRGHIDALALSFFQNVNPHYGMIHRTDFGREYNPRYLYSSMPADRHHKNNVLWMLHSTYWYKAEAMFAEACHVFYTAVREAQVLGFDTEQDVSGVPNFELEIRRRAWCVIDSWDWQIASGLCRKTMIDHSACSGKRPSLTLERDGEFSPLMHMNMQSDLIHRLAGRFPSPSQVQTRSEIMEYKDMIDEWMLNFPPIFALVDPDTSNDKRQAWIEYHRHYNYTMGYMMVLNPFRPHMALPYNDKSSEEELELRRIAVDLTLHLVQVLDNWLKFLTFRDGRFHFIIFSLVDAATVLSNMVLNDKTNTLPRRDDVYRTIKTALVLQRKLYFLSDSAKLGFRMVQRIARHLFRKTPKEYLASLGIDSGLNHDDAQPVLSDAPDRTSGGGALMSVQYMDPDDYLGPGLFSAAEIPDQTSSYEIQPQSALDTSLVVSNYSSDAAMVPGGYAGWAEPHIPFEHQMITSSQDNLSVIAASFDYAGPTIPIIPTNTGAASTDCISSASLHYSLSTPPRYDDGITTQYLPAATPTHVGFIPPGQVPIAPPDYAPAVSPAFVVTPSSGHVISGSSNYVATTSYYVAPGPTDHVIYAPPANTVDTSLNNVAVYTTVSSATYYRTATPVFVNPACLSTHGPSASSEYITATSALNPEPNTGISSTPIPATLTDITTYQTSTQHPPWTGFNDAKLYSPPDSHGSSAAIEAAVPFDAPSTYATLASYTSPGSHASSESYQNPRVAYDTPPSRTAPAYYTSPEGNASPESHCALGDYTVATPAASVLLGTGGDGSDHTGSTLYETPESYCTESAYTTPLNNFESPNTEPPI